MIDFEVEIPWEVEEGEERILKVSGEYDPPVSGNRLGHPDTWTPNEGMEIYIYLIDGYEHPLCDDERFIDAVADKILE